MTSASKLGSLVKRLVPNAHAYTLVRHETRAALQAARDFASLAHRRRTAELAHARALSVNLGTGGQGKPGWLNVDAVAHGDDTLTLDIRKPLPLADGSVKRLFAEHVIEHLHYRDEAPRVLSEIHRVLEPLGVARIIVPDAGRFVRAYASGDPKAFAELGWDLARLPEDIDTPMHVLNHIFHQDGEHYFGYDFETLSLQLQRAGFVEVVQQRYGQCLDPELVLDRAEHAPYSLYVDARK